MSKKISATASVNYYSDFLTLKGYWDFANNFDDISGEGNNLTSTGSPKLITELPMKGAVKFNGVDEWLSTDKPIIDAEKSYTVAAWVRLDSSTMNHRLLLKPKEAAFTAVSQDTDAHSNFCLGIRQIYVHQPDGVLTSSLRWTFTVSPIDGSETGPIEWQHAYAETPLTDASLDKWFLLVGVCDIENNRALIYVPNINETGMINLHKDLELVPSLGGIQIGRSRWLGRNVDFWPGTIGPVKVYSGAMDQHEARILYGNNDI